MEHLIKLGYTFIGVWALISIVGIIGFYIVVRNCKKESAKSYKEFKKEWDRHGRRLER
ncbi:hypothetical protein [Clostridium sp. BJN0013]|jgi:hypothetical protein|uniref:hypothetical protein n=1 Tax=Clostridium sp. BJN0013 TaxID=3236840 RepID=UPI0034C631C5